MCVYHTARAELAAVTWSRRLLPDRAHVATSRACSTGHVFGPGPRVPVLCALLGRSGTFVVLGTPTVVRQLHEVVDIANVRGEEARTDGRYERS